MLEVELISLAARLSDFYHQLSKAIQTRTVCSFTVLISFLSAVKLTLSPSAVKVAN